MSQSTQLSTFNFESNSIRTLVIHDEPWFVAKDLCDTLGIQNSRQALANLDEDERGMLNIHHSNLAECFDKRVNEIGIVNESGMYTLILRCRDAVKKGSIPHRFRKWVTAEVLPQIRKTGKYEHKTTVDDRTGLRNAVNMLVSKKGLIYSEAYNLVHQYMNVESIEDIPADKLQSAVEYVHKIVLEGELIEPKKNEIHSFEFTEYELQELAWLWFAFKRGVGTFQCIEKAFDILGSNMSGQIYGQAYEYLSILRSTNKILNRLTAGFEIDPRTNWRVLKHLRQFDLKAIKIDF